jgi:hypothetical protein
MVHLAIVIGRFIESVGLGNKMIVLKAFYCISMIPQKGLKGGEEGFVIVKKIRHLK